MLSGVVSHLAAHHHDLDFLSFLALNIKFLRCLFFFGGLGLFIEFVFRHILLFDRFFDVDTAYLNLAVANEAGALGLAFFEEFGLAVEFRSKVPDSVDSAIVLTRATLLCLQIPLDSDPQVISSFGIVQNLTNVSNRADVLIMLESCILVELVLFGIGDLYSDPLAEEILVLW